MTKRDDFIAEMAARGKSPEQTEAFLAIARSAFARRGWIAGKPDSRKELAGHVGRLVGQ